MQHTCCESVNFLVAICTLKKSMFLKSLKIKAHEKRVLDKRQDNIVQRSPESAQRFS